MHQDDPRTAVTRSRHERAAMRRLVGVVARRPATAEVGDAVSSELGTLLPVADVRVARFRADGVTAEVVGGAGTMTPHLPLGARPRVHDSVLLTLAADSVEPVRVRVHAGPGSAPWARAGLVAGMAEGIAAPVRVRGEVWGAVVVGAVTTGALSDDDLDVVAGVADLVGLAVGQQLARDSGRESAGRLVAAGDRVRRGIERDLHDGAQQRLVALAMDLRHDPDLDRTVAAGELDEVVADIRRIARGAHPVVLTEGGLRVALRGLVRRAGLPVELHVPAGWTTSGETSDVALYYVVSEALVNVARHAGATRATVSVEVGAREVSVRVRDDGRGGADVRRGTGLLGLRDRVEALGGGLEVHSPTDGGTTVTVWVPRIAA